MYSQPLPFSRTHKILFGLVLLAALAIRLFALTLVDTQPVTDFHWYFERATGIVTGYGFSEHGKATAYWPVGYPGTLALLFRLTGASVVAGKILNLILGLAGIYLSGRIAHRWSGSPWVAIGTILILAVNPAWIAYGQILASEPLYTFLTLLGMAWLPTKPIHSGLAWGYATLVRPQALLFAVINLALARKQLPKWGLLMCLGAALILPTVWTIRNKVMLGSAAFVSTNGGDNLLISAYGNGEYFQPAWMHQEDLSDNEIDAERFAKSKAMARIKEDPAHWCSLIPAKLLATFTKGTDSSYWMFQDRFGELIVPGKERHKAAFKAFRAYGVAYFPALLWVASIGFILVSARQLRHREAVKLADFQPHLMILGQAFVSAIFFGNPRFGYGVHPFLAMLAAAPLMMLTASQSQSDKS